MLGVARSYTVKRNHEKPAPRDITSRDVIKALRDEMTPIEKAAFVDLAMRTIFSPGEKPN